MKLTCPAFKNDQEIPARFSGEGRNVSPPLEWSGIPPNSKSFALLCEDPDASMQAGKEFPYVHWLLYNISTAVTCLPEGLSSQILLDEPALAAHGKNSFGNIGYNGPLPPVGHGAHRYVFTLHALNKVIHFPSAPNRAKFEEMIQGHILATAQLEGTYERTAGALIEKPEKKSA